ncbi:energy transducer TonB [Chryseolinea sp. H1M3-3]|uniref:energy transducer TonB n=1 Tax=Chryseolinea sp. H1M3-3 TaxID=3034144 RepID=UPI0023EE12DC|nr:energy transducer TonB [Chryseolinea sp. H1M3-3]
MKTKELDSSTWEDIVFENRNKAYGAYYLRNTYRRNIVIAVAIAVTIIAFVLAFPVISEFFKDNTDAGEVELKQIKYNELAPPPPIDKNTPPPPKLDVPPPVKTIIKFLPPKVTEKEIVEEEEMPTIEEIKQNDTGAETMEGNGDIVFDEPVEEVLKEKGDEDVIFTIVEQQAEFPGGFEAMVKFLAKNMKYPAAARRMGVEGSVFVSFVIDREGNISDPQVIKGISAECDKEAIRVVQLMPPWKPGKQNGKPVRCRFVLPIKFKLAV